MKILSSVQTDNGLLAKGLVASEADLANVPAWVTAGSKFHLAGCSKEWELDEDGQWAEMASSGGSGGGGGSVVYELEESQYRGQSGGTYGCLKTIAVAADIIADYVSGKTVILHVPSGISGVREQYLHISAYCPPWDNDGYTNPAIFDVYVAAQGALGSLYSSSGEVDQNDGKLYFTIYD